MYRKVRETQHRMSPTDMSEVHYRINEIFYSLQGEGYYTGTPAVFVRMSGCNCRCTFCDTDHADHTLMSVDEILAAVRRYPARHIVITGGEPSLQLEHTLVDALKNDGRYVAVETNGSNKVPDNVDWVTCSPKDLPVRIQRIDELKVVYQGDDVESLADRYSTPNLFLQPCSCSNIPATIAYVMEHPRWRLSLQTHKVLNIP